MINDAMEEYLARQERRRHPDGTFDKKSRWYPSGKEKQECCENIRGPSTAYPYSSMVHCRTVEHVANLYGLPAADLRRLVGIYKRYGSESTQYQVALVTGRLGGKIPLIKIPENGKENDHAKSNDSQESAEESR